jgi:hypothetical protein
MLVAEESGQLTVHKFNKFLHGREPRSIPWLSAAPAQPGDDGFFIHFCLKAGYDGSRFPSVGHLYVVVLERSQMAAQAV